MNSQNKFIAKGIFLVYFWLIVIATLATLFSCEPAEEINCNCGVITDVFRDSKSVFVEYEGDNPNGDGYYTGQYFNYVYILTECYDEPNIYEVGQGDYNEFKATYKVGNEFCKDK